MRRPRTGTRTAALTGARTANRAWPLKRQLPPPYHLNLAPILRGLAPRKRIPYFLRANDPVTAAFVAAAYDEIQHVLGPGNAGKRELLSFLSQREIVRAAGDLSHPAFPRRLTQQMLRDRWPRHPLFIADVIRFCLWRWHFPTPDKSEAAGLISDVLDGQDPVGAIYRLCQWDLSRHVAEPAFRLSLVAAAEAEGDPVIGEAMNERYHEGGRLWRRLYRTFLTAKGLRLRPDISMTDCAILLSALADGLALRALTATGAEAARISGARCLLGKGALAIIAGCTAGAADGRSLEQLVRSLLAEDGGAP